MANKCTPVFIAGIFIPVLLNGCSSGKNKAYLDPKVFPPQIEGGPTIPSPDEPGLPVPGPGSVLPINESIPIPYQVLPLQYL